jgi:hypothetical protein
LHPAQDIILIPRLRKSEKCFFRFVKIAARTHSFAEFQIGTLSDALGADVLWDFDENGKAVKRDDGIPVVSFDGGKNKVVMFFDFLGEKCFRFLTCTWVGIRFV